MDKQLINTHRPVTICRASAGTGKTYTLAAYYVGLLLSGEDYRSILAITFTNKATAEMSERIMGYLYSISQGGEKPFLARARQFMVRDAQAPDEELQRRARLCFRRMLLDYDNVQVQTIDSFLQTLLSGLAGVLRMSAGLSTELDIDHVIAQAVDQLLTTEMTAADRSILEDYMRLKLDEQSRWDIRQNLCAMAKELYGESVQMLDANGLICFDTEAIERRRKVVEELWNTNELVEELRQVLAGCNPDTFNRNTLYGYNRLMRSLEAPEKMSADDRFRGVTSKSSNSEDMSRASALAGRVGRFYNTLQLTVRFSRDMELMASLQALIQRNLAEANCALLARTASTLSNALRQGDADFILEKAGIRYKHILIDEFQDTSRLQWSVIERLLQDVLAGAGHTLLIVGDIKQSIYRWRNGDWHIMESLTSEEGNELTKDRLNPDFTSLTRNFRSSENVVNFNLSLFRHIVATYRAGSEKPDSIEQELIERIYGEGFKPEDLDQFYQSDKKKGGFVRFRAFPKRRPTATPDDAPKKIASARELMTRDMFDAMESLLAQGALPSDMMILVRERKDAAYITDLHITLDAERYPLLTQAHIVSADSFLLEASQAVLTVIAALQYAVRNDDVAAKYIELATQKPDIIDRIKERVTSKTPLYEAVSELIKLLLADTDGQYKGSETAYINSLLDRTREYVSAYGSRIDDFLTYWDDTLHEKPIPASASDAIRILTVHASKGLQAQTLFVPFCTWTKETGQHPQKIWCQVPDTIDESGDFVPIQDGPEMCESAYHRYYEEEHLNLRIDNLNMLYVALTRAEDNLYISADFPITTKGCMGTCNRVGRYLLDYTDMNETVLREDLPVTLDGAPYAEYAVGQPVIANRQLSNRQLSADNKPFSFSGVPTEYAELWSNSDHVRFVQSQEGALYTDYGDEAYRRVARMDFGNLCHEIFAHLHKADELEQVLDDFESQGQIASKEQRDELKALISSAWEGNEQMRDWFTAPWQLKLEEAIYDDRRELRPDRVMINPQTNEAIVLDYKFGVWEDKYIQQVREYMEALRHMGYAPVRGYLWFARKNQLVTVNS